MLNRSADLNRVEVSNSVKNKEGVIFSYIEKQEKKDSLQGRNSDASILVKEVE